jgi:hypothetical protein
VIHKGKEKLENAELDELKILKCNFGEWTGRALD